MFIIILSSNKIANPSSLKRINLIHPLPPPLCKKKRGEKKNEKGRTPQGKEQGKVALGCVCFLLLWITTSGPKWISIEPKVKRISPGSMTTPNKQRAAVNTTGPSAHFVWLLVDNVSTHPACSVTTQKSFGCQMPWDRKLRFQMGAGGHWECICSSNVPLVQFQIMLNEGKEMETCSQAKAGWNAWFFFCGENYSNFKKSILNVRFLPGFSKALYRNKTSPP